MGSFGDMIKAQFKPSDIHKMMHDKIAKMEKSIQARLIRIGNKFVRDARDNADFTDRTGNLRSSIGYVLFEDGKPIKSDFDQTKEGMLGLKQAEVYANTIAAEYADSRYVLIVVAGMEYAAHVESKGFDVLTGSSISATADLNKYFKAK